MIKKLKFISPINKLGYGYVGINLLKAFIKAGVDISLEVIGHVDLEEYDKPFFEKANSSFKDETGIHTLVLWHQFDLEKYKKHTGKTYGFPIFELDRLNQQEAKSINSMDGLFATCEFYKKILEKYTFKPVYKAVLGVDHEIFNPSKNIKEEGKLKFLHVGKYEIRKSVDKIIKCFGKVFNKIPGQIFYEKENVSLTLACYNPFLSKSENDAWENTAKKYVNNINIIKNRFKTQEEIAELMASHDVGLFPARAEGMNLELIEMLAQDKPVITTYYSAHTEFCNEKNAYLIYPDEENPTEEAFDGQFFFNSGSWMKFGNKQEEQFQNILLDIYNNWKNSKLLKTKQNSVSHLTWDNTVQCILKVLYD